MTKEKGRIEISVSEGLVQEKKKILQKETVVSFNIKTSNFGWEVRRRDEEFNSIH